MTTNKTSIFTSPRFLLALVSVGVTIYVGCEQENGKGVVPAGTTRQGIAQPMNFSVAFSGRVSSAPYNKGLNTANTGGEPSEDVTFGALQPGDLQAIPAGANITLSTYGSGQTQQNIYDFKTIDKDKGGGYECTTSAGMVSNQPGGGSQLVLQTFGLYPDWEQFVATTNINAFDCTEAGGAACSGNPDILAIHRVTKHSDKIIIKMSRINNTDPTLQTQRLLITEVYDGLANYPGPMITQTAGGHTFLCVDMTPTGALRLNATLVGINRHLTNVPPTIHSQKIDLQWIW